MSWSRRAVLALSILPLGGCFRPMLAENAPASELRGRVALPEIDGRFGYHLTKSLEDRLGKPSDPVWRLAVVTEVTERGLAVAQDNAVTRITLIASADWRLIRDGEDVLREKVSAQSGYNATSSLFATRQTRRDVERRLARDLGERIARTVLAKAEQVTP